MTCDGHMDASCIMFRESDKVILIEGTYLNDSESLHIQISNRLSLSSEL